jgi:sec-independent protein translocase protein TatA
VAARSSATALLGRAPVTPEVDREVLGLGDLLSPTHLIIVLAIALLVFGPKRLPELGSGLGRSLKAFRDATSGATDAIRQEIDHPATTPSDPSGNQGSSTP